MLFWGSSEGPVIPGAAFAVPVRWGRPADSSSAGSAACQSDSARNTKVTRRWRCWVRALHLTCRLSSEQGLNFEKRGVAIGNRRRMVPLEAFCVCVFVCTSKHICEYMPAIKIHVYHTYQYIYIHVHIVYTCIYTNMNIYTRACILMYTHTHTSIWMDT